MYAFHAWRAPNLDVPETLGQRNRNRPHGLPTVTYTWNSLIFAGCCRKGAPLTVAGRRSGHRGPVARHHLRHIYCIDVVGDREGGPVHPLPATCTGPFSLDPNRQPAMISAPRLSVAWAARQARLWLKPQPVTGAALYSGLMAGCSPPKSRFFGIFLENFWVARGGPYP
jgi:hypothetical protein